MPGISSTEKSVQLFVVDAMNALAPWTPPARQTPSSGLAGSAWDTDEAGERPWQWATLCRTAMPDGADIRGDRDCPR